MWISLILNGHSPKAFLWVLTCFKEHRIFQEFRALLLDMGKYELDWCDMMCVCIQMCVRMWVPLCVSLCEHEFVHTCMPLCMHVSMSACLCVYACVCACAFVSVCMCVYVCMYTWISMPKNMGRSQKMILWCLLLHSILWRFGTCVTSAFAY